MFRTLFRRPRTIRVPVENANIDIHRVNVTKQGKQFKSRPAVAQFMITGVFAFLTIQGMKYFDPFGQYQDQNDISNKNNTKGDSPSRYGTHWDEQHSQRASDTSSKVPIDLANPDLIRLTIPIWLRKGSLRPYLPNDPVFKDYQKLQSDKKRVSDLKKLVIESIFKAIKTTGVNMPELKLIGFTGKLQSQLDIVPQLYAPPIYQVPCIWISAGSLPEYGWRSLPPDTGARVERIFRPFALLEAAAMTTRIFVQTAYIITKARVNEALIGKRPGSSGPTLEIPQLPPPPPTTEKSSSSTPPGIVKSSTPIFPFLPDFNDGQGTRKMHQEVVSAMPYSLAIQQAAHAFNHFKVSKQSHAISQNVRGAVQIRGVIRFLGERGQFWMEIAVCYLPSENMFLGPVDVKQRYVIPDYPQWGKEYEATAERNRKEVERRREMRKQESAASQSNDTQSSETSTSDEDVKK